MPQYPTILRCSQTTATIVFILVGSLFLAAGCAQFYRAIGLTEEQTAGQIKKDQDDRQQIIEGIRLTTTELITSAIAGLGAIASGFLARALGTERKITKVLIGNIETNNNENLKTAITAEALQLGIENKLYARVKALT